MIGLNSFLEMLDGLRTKADYLEQALLDHIFGANPGGAFAQPATHVALSTTTPNDDGTNFTEPTGTWYGRVQVNDIGGASPAWQRSGSVVDNAQAIDFGTVTADDNGIQVTHFGVYDAATAGNLLYWGALTVSKTLNTNDPVSFPIGDLDISED